MVALTVNHYHVGPQEAKTAIEVRGTKGLHHLSSHHHPLTEGMSVTGAPYRWFP